MADSVGGSGFPKTGIQEGHLHFDKVNNILYIWNGGDPANDANWSVVGGSGVSSAGATIVISRGPILLQSVPDPTAALDDVSVTVVDRGGPLSIRAAVVFENASAAQRIGQVSIAKNGAQIVSTFMEVEISTLSGAPVVVEHFDSEAEVGDVYTILVGAAAGDADFRIGGNMGYLVVEALGVNTTLVAGLNVP